MEERADLRYKLVGESTLVRRLRIENSEISVREQQGVRTAEERFIYNWSLKKRGAGLGFLLGRRIKLNLTDENIQVKRFLFLKPSQKIELGTRIRM